MTDVRELAARPPASDPADLVARHGLRRAGARPPLGAYVRELWGRRYFIVAFSRARNEVGYSSSVLGQAWQLLTPLLNALIYYLIFGLLLSTRHGVHNFIGFLVSGIFVFTFMQTSVMQGARAIAANVGLTRVLQFPRAALPVSTSVVALQQLLVSLVVLLPILLFTGERPAFRWLLVVPAVLLETMFCAGLALAVARVGAKLPDTSQFLPFLVRTWLYASGIFYSIKALHLDKTFHSTLPEHLLLFNPGAVYVEIMRDALLSGHPLSPYEWPIAVGWAVVALVGGFVFFWRAEEQYGRV